MDNKNLEISRYPRYSSKIEEAEALEKSQTIIEDDSGQVGYILELRDIERSETSSDKKRVLTQWKLHIDDLETLPFRVKEGNTFKLSDSFDFGETPDGLESLNEIRISILEVSNSDRVSIRINAPESIRLLRKDTNCSSAPAD